MIGHTFFIRACALRAATAFGFAMSWPLCALAAPDPACNPMFDAFTKLLQTPNHQYMSQSSSTDALTHGGQLRTSETISTADASFVKVKGEWRKVPITAEDMLKQQEEARQNAQESCHLLTDDATEPDAIVYDSLNETPKGKSSLKIWISKTSGLPLREEIDLDLSDTGKSHSSVRFVYGHVEPPADAK